MQRLHVDTIVTPTQLPPADRHPVVVVLTVLGLTLAIIAVAAMMAAPGAFI